MKRFPYILTLLAIFCTPVAFGATREQMDKAKAIAYKYCLRYMNNGSGYLDDKNPGSTADLQSVLKEKEKNNLRTLQQISIPPESEYSKWDKEQFNKFWKDTFFANKTLQFNAKGACKAKAAAEISKIAVTVAETKPEPADQPAETKEQQPATTEEKKTEERQTAEQPAEDPMSTLVEVPADTAVEAVEVPVEAITPAEVEPEKSSSNTSAIIILCVLVLVVVGLVAYALNVMKRNRARQAEDYDRRDEDEYRERQERHERDERRRFQPERQPRDSRAYTVQSDPEEESPFAAYSAYSEPAPEPAAPRRETPRSARDREIEQLRAEVESLREQLGEAHTRRATRYTPGSRTQGPAHIIYLAQANLDGVFVRADARYNPGNSIFRLVTTDGVSGSFSVIDNAAVHDMALSMPQDFLATACYGRNLQNTRGVDAIINETSGTAIFEDGRWYVTRKAQIRYSRQA
ncbi:MAG: hypothetical protein J6L73_03165 [Muribaculaceae bacterium]|nr:hypothetical protein [Muribaculaceae bacterium]